MKPKILKRLYCLLTLAFLSLCVYFLSVEPQTEECDILAILNLLISAAFFILFSNKANK